MGGDVDDAACGAEQGCAASGRRPCCRCGYGGRTASRAPLFPPGSIPRPARRSISTPLWAPCRRQPLAPCMYYSTEGVCNRSSFYSKQMKNGMCMWFLARCHYTEDAVILYFHAGSLHSTRAAVATPRISIDPGKANLFAGSLYAIGAMHMFHDYGLSEFRIYE